MKPASMGRIFQDTEDMEKKDMTTALKAVP